MTFQDVLQFPAGAAADPSGPQARHFAEATLDVYRLVQAAVGAIRLLRKLRRAVPARPAEPDSVRAHEAAVGTQARIPLRDPGLGAYWRAGRRAGRQLLERFVGRGGLDEGVDVEAVGQLFGVAASPGDRAVKAITP
ncbi:hypothetical protein [Kitasatospora cathayae]|uniref:Uncharacterized protein n=1 Tax=Kitasatospora cathayae TaxID=3004092 RepID=A0ABY7QEW2_9ACTN|nr:hypothetical protein [Kitasatospora sp. HUAS 3-15]WBP91258.1 hypothetical protein O1G21_38855 [Kitasatospora sp. HUAS 3-15]